MKVTVVDAPSAESQNQWYGGGRSPLMPAHLHKLPLGAVRPKGWLRHQLDLMTTGMVGRLPELSKFLTDDNGWLGGGGDGWEEQPYWLRGFYPLAVLAGDENLKKEANRWIEAIIASQDNDGFFGARCLKRIQGKQADTTDLWPHMIVLDALIQHHELTGDERVVPLMENFFRFCKNIPDESFIQVNPQYNWNEQFDDWHPVIQHGRAGDMLPHIHWLYGRIGGDWLLDLGTRFYRHIEPPLSEWIDDHVVNFTQRFQYPGAYYVQSRKPWHLNAVEFWYNQHMLTWGQQPRGIFAADERIRSGKVDPRQGAETCAMVEFAKSFYLLGRITGNTLYADRCEDVMLNHFPASQTPDLKGLHYNTASNLPQLDKSANHDFTNEAVGWGNHLIYSPHKYRCCQHNVAMGWPWYAQNLWQTTPDAGLASWLYAACEVSARAGDEGREVTLHVDTAYPFGDTVEIVVQTEAAVEFPLYLRIPAWCKKFGVKVNGSDLPIPEASSGFVRIEATWADGDRIRITMPMEISLTRWPRNGAATVDRGPLSYSVAIEEEWRQCGGTQEWPEYEVLPKSPWNYGLLLDDKMEVAERTTSAANPFTLESAPLQITASAKKIPNWRLIDETVQPLQTSPIKSDQPTERIRLIPMGCARLRMACLPVIGDGPEAEEWR